MSVLHPLRVACFEPDIPQNLGTIFRMGACLGVAVDVIEPCGFPLDERKFRRAGMDYIDHVSYQRHASFADFRIAYPKHRIILLSSKAKISYTDFVYQPQDILLVGRETAGVPADITDTLDHRVTIPMQPDFRSLNVAISIAMVTGEALRQLQCQEKIS